MSKARALALIVSMASEYHAVFGGPLPYAAISRRLHKRFNAHAAVDELIDQGLARAYLNPRGAKALALSHLTYSVEGLGTFKAIPLKD